jgi:hypothetical protein
MLIAIYRKELQQIVHEIVENCIHFRSLLEREYSEPPARPRDSCLGGGHFD